MQKWLTSQAAAFYEEGIQKLVPRYDKCSIMAANMWKNSLKNVESDNNKILYETLLDFFTAIRYILSELASYIQITFVASGESYIPYIVQWDTYACTWNISNWRNI